MAVAKRKEKKIINEFIINIYLNLFINFFLYLVCGVSVTGDVCTVTSCGLEDNGKLFIDGGKIFEVSVTKKTDKETGLPTNQISRECVLKKKGN